MADFKGKTFENQAVLLDGNTYEHCEFRGCNLIFNGTTSTSLANINETGCQWSFDGPVARAVQFLKELHQMGGGARRHVEQTLRNIRTIDVQAET